MPTDTFRSFEKVCIALKLEKKHSKNGSLYIGKNIIGEFVRISIHKHAMGRDIATGTFKQYLKDLGFNSFAEYLQFKKNI